MSVRANVVLVASLATLLLSWTPYVRAQITIPPTPALPLQAPIRDLQKDLGDMFADPNFSNAIWGVSVQSMETGEYLFRLNENKTLLPASNFKIVTAAEALSLLTPEWRYSTMLLTPGKISDGVIKGDLVIRGSGDPTLGSDSMFPDSAQTWIFEAWADSLKRLGVTKVDGNILGDDTYFTEDIYPYGWAIEDIPYYYTMQSTALAFAENAVTVSVTPALTKGASVRYEMSPLTDYLTVDNRTLTKADSIVTRIKGKDSVLQAGSSSISITRDIGSNTVLLRGQIPMSGQMTHEQLSVENPTLFAATVFREVLEERGIQVTGKTRSARDLTKPIPYLKSKVLATYVSPPISEIVAVMNKQSNNLYAEQLFRTVAKELGGEGSWKKGTEVMKRFLGALALDTSRIAIYDGSGLSRMDLVTAQQITTLLRAMYERKNLFDIYYSSMAIMGVDGTLSKRLKDTRAQGNVHAKTGFVTEVRSISGYVTTRDGELLGFSILGNGLTSPVSLANNLHDLVMLRLANFSRK